MNDPIQDRIVHGRVWKMGTPENEIIDGTNNHCERAIVWWIQAHYRSMRGYKQEPCVFGVSRLIALAENHLYFTGRLRAFPN
jgi:hypothetical protein